MSDRVEQELELLEAYHDLEYRQVAGVHWARIPRYPIPAGWSETEAEVALQVPSSAGQAPYAFWVRPGLHVAGGGQPDRYTYPASTPWGDDWGQFSWAPVQWVPKEDVRAGANMLNFVRSFAERLMEGR
jgi:hypothetical protein